MEREQMKKRTVQILEGRVGKQYAISANQLFIMVTGDTLIPAQARNQTRIIRRIVKELRYVDKMPILSGSRGYWIAESETELRAFTDKLLRTGTGTLRLAHKLSGIPIDRMVEQFKLDLESEENQHDNEN